MTEKVKGSALKFLEIKKFPTFGKLKVGKGFESYKN